jgi:A/G-specific adenine glycosylase
MVELKFAEQLVAWQREHGRHDLPWQVSDPYRVWLSEIMLQQTQVSSVLQYYARFLARFPTLPDLARAPVEDVLALWSGLGYYSRARNLHRAAREVMDRFDGRFPDSRGDIETLPGVGRSTAAAIAAFAFGRREAILDGNVKRVLARVFAIEGFPGERKVENALWDIAERLLPDHADMAAYTQGLMDLGATVCRRGRPLCAECPLQLSCLARQQGREGELPTPRPKKAQPVRHAMLLLAVYRGQVYLERRPPTGIWGGLLSLPECTDSSEAERWLARHGAGDLLPAWPEVEHVFTHFRLIMTPQPIRLDVLRAEARDGTSGDWVALADAGDAGVPAPVRRLLSRLAASPG